MLDNITINTIHHPSLYAKLIFKNRTRKTCCLSTDLASISGRKDSGQTSNQMPTMKSRTSQHWAAFAARQCAPHRWQDFAERWTTCPWSDRYRILRSFRRIHSQTQEPRTREDRRLKKQFQCIAFCNIEMKPCSSVYAKINDCYKQQISKYLIN